jgi:hypothetical protein
MTTTAKTAFKTQFQYGDGATPELFLTIAELRTIDPPEAVAKMAEVTSHDSTKAEFIATYVDEGEVSLEGNWTADTTQSAMLTKLGGTASNYQLCLPDFGVRTATFTAETTDVCTSNTHGMTTGQPVRVSSSGSPEDLPAGLSSGVTYYVRWASADTFTLHTTNAGAVANTGKVDITDAGTGTHTVSMGTRVAFAAIIQSFKASAPLDGAQGVTIKAKITEAATYTT